MDLVRLKRSKVWHHANRRTHRPYSHCGHRLRGETETITIPLSSKFTPPEGTRVCERCFE